MSQMVVRFVETTGKVEYLWEGRSFTSEEIRLRILNTSRPEQLALLRQYLKASSDYYEREKRNGFLGNDLPEAIAFTRIQTKRDVEILEHAIAQVLQTFLIFLKKTDKQKPRKPKSRVMWRARRKAEKFVNYWIDEQNDLEYFQQLRPGDDVARRVFKKTSQLFKNSPLDHRKWKRTLTQGKTLRRHDVSYLRALCRWYAKVMTVVYAMGTPKNSVPLSYARPQTHLKSFRKIASYDKVIKKVSKQCLSNLSEHGAVLKELYNTWTEFLPLELLNPILSVEPKPATKQALLTVGPVPTGAQGDQANGIQSVIETYASPPRIVIDLED